MPELKTGAELLIDWPLDIAMNLRARACARIGTSPYVPNSRYLSWIAKPTSQAPVAVAALLVAKGAKARDKQVASLRLGWWKRSVGEMNTGHPRRGTVA